MITTDTPTAEDSSLVKTDTPRADAVEFRHCPPQPEAMLKKHEDAYALSRELERELNELWSRFDKQMEAEAEELASALTELCREREARQKADGEISMWRDGGIMHEDHSNEIDELKAEVERLTESLKHAELWGSFEKQVTAQLEITGLKAEVERLKANLRRAIEIAECGLVGPSSDQLRSELNQLEATLNPATEESSVNYDNRSPANTICLSEHFDINI